MKINEVITDIDDYIFIEKILLKSEEFLNLPIKNKTVYITQETLPTFWDVLIYAKYMIMYRPQIKTIADIDKVQSYWYNEFLYKEPNTLNATILRDKERINASIEIKGNHIHTEEEWINLGEKEIPEDLEILLFQEKLKV